MSLLEARGLSKRFGGLQAVRDLSFVVAEGELLGLIGPNGAGKTTAFNLLSGFLRPDAGAVTFRGRSLVGLKPHAICRLGLARTFQIVRPFPRLSALDNVTVGALARHPRAPEALAHARAVLERVGLAARQDAVAGSLTLAERKRLELARALATDPALLLLDEVMAGLRPTETDQMVAVFRRLNEEHGLTILLIEHVMRAVMALSREIHVLHHGVLIASGSPDDVVRHPAVLDCYLGEEAV